MNAVIKAKLHNIKAFFVYIGTASFLQWLTYQLLTHAKLGSSAECFALAQTFVVFLAAPYLAAYRVHSQSIGNSSAHLLSLSPISFSQLLLIRLVTSQLPFLYWIFLSTCFALFAFDMPIEKAMKMLGVLGLYSFSAAAVAMLGAYFLRDNILGTAATYFLFSILISSPFLMMPLRRYIHDLQPIIQPMLHLNPIIAVFNIFDGMDVFRNPLFYERTPITDYDFSYPSWSIISCWQLLIGAVCFLLTWLMCRPSKFTGIY